MFGALPIQKTLALAEELKRLLNGKCVNQSALAYLDEFSRARTNVDAGKWSPIVISVESQIGRKLLSIFDAHAKPKERRGGCSWSAIAARRSHRGLDQGSGEEKNRHAAATAATRARRATTARGQRLPISRNRRRRMPASPRRRAW